jgi:hypothetical protein
VFALAFYLRTAGLMRGLPDSSYVYHPDEPKQVAALSQYLHGRYVWYQNSPFYDGYPLALNHLDEWLMRPALALRDLCLRHLSSEARAEPVPGRQELFRWARALRVVYAMAIMLLAWRLARRLFAPWWAQALVLLLLAIAPLPVTASHFGSGDIGVDLFTAAALLALAGYAARPQRWRIALAGLLIGFGFACKYQGALVAAVPGLYLVAEALATRQARRMVQDGLLTLGCAAAAAALATPALFINAAQTWKDMRINFAFIRNYDVSSEFLALPLTEQLRSSLVMNAPVICAALGAGLMLLAAAGAVCAGAAWLRARAGQDAEARRSTSLWVALTGAPFFIMAVSLAGKPDVQPFHFSYLQLPFCVAAVSALTVLATRGRAAQIAAFLLGCLCVAEFGLKSERENFFWAREDTAPYKHAFEAGVFRAGPVYSHGKEDLKRVFLEASSPSSFRNRTREVRSAHASFWKELHAAPVPSVPWSLDADWIFDNGPVFPRNDRMFRVAANDAAERQVVLYAPPATILCGLRSGEFPLQVQIDLGGTAQTVRLPPHAQRVLAIQPRRWRAIKARESIANDTWFVPLHVRAENGPVWVTVMSDAQDLAMFQLFAGESDQPPVWPAPIKDAALIGAVEATRYVENSIPMAEGGSVLRQPVLADELALPAGLYTLECDVLSEGTGEVVLTVGDHINGGRGHPLLNVRHTFQLEPGLQSLRLPFSKAFAPYTVALRAECTNAATRVLGWRLRPDAAGLTAAWRQWQSTGQRPAWLRTWPESPAATNHTMSDLDATYKGGLRLVQGGVPATARQAEAFAVQVSMQAEQFPIRNFGELNVFVHWLRNGEYAGASDAPLWEVLVASAAGRPLALAPPPGLAPGHYEIVLGIYNTRTRLQLPVAGPRLTPREVRNNFVRIGKAEMVD